VLISYIDRSQRTNQYTKLPPTDDDSICGHRSTSGIVIYFSVARLRQVVSGIMTTMDTATSSSGTQILSTRLQGRQTNTVISSVPTMVGGGPGPCKSKPPNIDSSSKYSHGTFVIYYDVIIEVPTTGQMCHYNTL